MNIPSISNIINSAPQMRRAANLENQGNSDFCGMIQPFVPPFAAATWTCPICCRSFRNANQQHACKLADKEDFFKNRPPHLRPLFDRIVEKVSEFGEFREEAVTPGTVYFKTKSTFLGVKIKKDRLEVEFFLDHVEDVPPVSKYLRTSKNRVAHVVPVDAEEDLSERVFEWVRASYELIVNA